VPSECQVGRSRERPGERAPAAGNHLNTELYVKSKKGIKLRDLTVRRLMQQMRVSMSDESDEPACKELAQREVLVAEVYAEFRDHGY
jgi:hypothetical protein